MGGRSRTDRAIDGLVGWGQAIAWLGAVWLLAASALSVVRYREEYGTWRPWVTFPARFRACGGRTYHAGNGGPYADQIVAESRVRIDHTPGGQVYAADPCHATGCPEGCGVPTVVVVRDGEQARVYALSGGP